MTSLYSVSCPFLIQATVAVSPRCGCVFMGEVPDSKQSEPLYQHLILLVWKWSHHQCHVACTDTVNAGPLVSWYSHRLLWSQLNITHTEAHRERANSVVRGNLYVLRPTSCVTAAFMSRWKSKNFTCLRTRRMQQSIPEAVFTGGKSEWESRIDA